jgi:hypothetical protein
MQRAPLPRSCSKNRETRFHDRGTRNAAPGTRRSNLEPGLLGLVAGPETNWLGGCGHMLGGACGSDRGRWWMGGGKGT